MFKGCAENPDIGEWVERDKKRKMKNENERPFWALHL